MIHCKAMRMFLSYIGSKTTQVRHAERLNSAFWSVHSEITYVGGHFITDYNGPSPGIVHKSQMANNRSQRRTCKQSWGPAIVPYSSGHVLHSTKRVITLLVVWLPRLTTVLVISAVYFFKEKNGTRSGNRCLKHVQRVYGSSVGRDIWSHNSKGIEK